MRRLGIAAPILANMQCQLAVVSKAGPGRCLSRPFSAKKASPLNTSLLLQSAASRAQAATAAHPQRDCVSTLVWGLRSPVKPRVHVVSTPPLAAGLAAEELVPLGLNEMQQDVLTKSNFGVFLAKNLVSRAVSKRGVSALVLSANFLPSQLAWMADLAGKQALQTQVYIDQTPSHPSSTLHVAFYKGPAGPEGTPPCWPVEQQHISPSDLQQVLSAALGRPLQPLARAKLQVATMAEEALQQQLRLWEPVVWSSALQQRLESRKRASTALAVRSLMGPAALEAARNLVEKKGLHWLELPEEEMQALAGANRSSSRGGSRRRMKRGTTSAGAAPESGVGGDCCGGNSSGSSGASGTVVVISRIELDPEEAMQLPAEAFTDSDGVGGCGGGSSTVLPAAQQLQLPHPLACLLGMRPGEQK